ncbi:hypothetical protein OHAE_1983 [Ochrobactrum soli]|uniref:Uncharacterized protein n=1 Tax=Ochrobactrum soli TaxID=2448455 RepID=A0A2P9HPQ8_9HYPH|nr:hypothetical protein OHAE_1983 [[Ochrobactrum] soli]
MAIRSRVCERNFRFAAARFSEKIFLVYSHANGNYRHQGGLGRMII